MDCAPGGGESLLLRRRKIILALITENIKDYFVTEIKICAPLLRAQIVVGETDNKKAATKSNGLLFIAYNYLGNLIAACAALHLDYHRKL